MTMTTVRQFAAALGLVILAVLACNPEPGPIAAGDPANLPAMAPQPTYTLLPTYTPYPTNTPYSTATASPAPTTTPTPTTTATPLPTVTPALTSDRPRSLSSQPRPTLVEWTFEGDSDSVVGPIFLESGLVILDAEHNGSENFIVRLIGDHQDEGSINTIGRYRGVRAHRISTRVPLTLQPGEIRLEVVADGPWTITARQQFPSSGSKGTYSHAGNSGDRVITWLEFDREAKTLSASHSGSGNFIVELLSADGQTSELLVNEIGSYAGQTVMNVPPGLYAMVVRAEGKEGNVSLSIQ